MDLTTIVGFDAAKPYELCHDCKLSSNKDVGMYCIKDTCAHWLCLSCRGKAGRDVCHSCRLSEKAAAADVLLCHFCATTLFNDTEMNYCEKCFSICCRKCYNSAYRLCSDCVKTVLIRPSNNSSNNNNNTTTTAAAKVHLYIQNRGSSGTFYIVQGPPLHLLSNLNESLNGKGSAFHRQHTQSAIVEDKELGWVLKIQGWDREKIKKALISEGICEEDSEIHIHTQ